MLYIYFTLYCSVFQQACSTDGQVQEDVSWNVWLFFLAQLLHGAGASPLYTLGVTYIDENVSKKMSSVYLGKCFKDSFIEKPNMFKENASNVLFDLNYKIMLAHLM